MDFTPSSFSKSAPRVGLADFQSPGHGREGIAFQLSINHHFIQNDAAHLHPVRTQQAGKGRRCPRNLHIGPEEFRRRKLPALLAAAGDKN